MKRLGYILIAFALLLCSAVSALAADAPEGGNTLEIKPQSGEKWWGLIVDTDNIVLPFEQTFSVDNATVSPILFKANLMLSNRGRYVWSDKDLVVRYDGKKFYVEVAGGGEAPLLSKSGRTLREAYLMCCHKHFPPKDVATPELLFGGPIYELGGADALLYTQQDVVAFADRLVERKVPSGTILLPMGWNSASGAPTFDYEAYPDPKAMVDQLHAKGMDVMLTVTPYVMAAGRGFQQQRKDGGLICDAAGVPEVFETRYGFTACRKLTDECVATINSQLRQLQTKYGVDGFYFDCLDALPLLGDNPEKLDEFLAIWHKAGSGLGAVVYCTPTSQLLGSDAATVSATRLASWQTLERDVETAIDASVLGFTRTCIAADLDFPACGKGNPEWNERIVLRTAQFAAMMPIAIIPYAVWEIGDQKAVDELLAWRGQMSSYYLDLARQSATSAEPIIRHLEYQYPRAGFSNCRDQFMVGDKYLVAPVVADGQRRMVRLPKGKWQDQSGRITKGPRVVDVDVSSGSMVVYKVAK